VQSIGWDITERCTAEANAHSVDARMRALLDATPDGITITALDGGIVFASRHALGMFGLAGPESVIGHHLLEFVAPGWRQMAQERIAMILEGIHTGPTEYKVLNRLRGEFWVETNGDVLRDGRGNPHQILLVIRDITDRKRALLALEESHSQWRHVISTAAEGFWMIDRNRLTVDVNAALCRMLGYSREDMLGRTPLEFTDGENQAIFRAQMGQIGTTYQRDYEITLTRKDGTPLPTYFHATTHRDGQGEVEMAFAFVTDLTDHKRAQNALKASEARYRRIVETANEGMWEMDREHMTTFVNSVMAGYLGYQPQDMIGRPIVDFMFPEDLPEHRLRMRERHEGRQGDYERRFRHANGEERWLHVSATPLVEADRGFLGSFAMLLDITERKQSEEKLRQAAAVFENTIEGVMITDPDARIVAVNRAFTEITGFGEAEALGRNASFMQSGKHDDEYYQAMWQALDRGGSWRGEIWNRRKSGEIYPEWLTISVVRDSRGHPSHYVGVFSDITGIKKSEEELNRLAYHDALTGLPNRLLFLDRIDHAIQRASRTDGQFAILFIDLDRFKNVNDTLGHHTGDLLLVAMAERIRKRLRAEDTLARLGGDEFTVLMESLAGGQENPHLAAQLAHDLINTMAQPFQVAGHDLFHSASIGISLFPQDGQDAETLVKHADTAMYRAKDAGRNGFQFYTRELSVAALQRFSLEAALHTALERGEFELYYQPQLEMRSGRVVSMEALIRWNHPNMGMVAPDQFIPLAEETGLILPIGAWVLETACREALKCAHLCTNRLTIAVNLSVTELERGNPVQHVARVLARTGLPPACLELEITESSAMRRGEESLAVLRELAALGVRLSIDDFGSGYSNLGYLKRLPVSSLKIDRLFVRELPDDAEDATIARAIIGLAHALNLQVVAEGVETSAQRDFLTLAGCDVMQGYLIGRPMPSGEIENLMRGLNSA
jgi:diguanylate cyclase (GGDEF)-like protein/PAS domain S-box-containing protein